MIKRVLVLILILAAAVWLRNSHYADYLTLSALKSNAEALKAYTDVHFSLSASMFVAAYVVVAGLNIPGAVIMSLCGGYLFGAVAGTAFAVTGATLGASAGFLVSRYLLGSMLQRKYSGQLRKMNRELEKNGHLYMLTLRLVPVFPFFLINILAGLTTLRLITFFWTSYLGMIPGGFVFVYAGSRLKNVHRIGDIFSTGMLSAFALLGLLMLIPVLYQKVIKRA